MNEMRIVRTEDSNAHNLLLLLSDHCRSIHDSAHWAINVLASWLPAWFISCFTWVVCIMFSSLGLFSRVQCPEDGSCSLPRCLFLHGSTETGPVKADSPATTEGAPVAVLSGDSASTRSAKRRKVEASVPDAESTRQYDADRGSVEDGRRAAPIVQSSTTRSSERHRGRSTEKSSSQTATQTISPPPLRARAGNMSNRVTASHGLLNDTYGRTTARTSSARARPSVQETLNPRLLPNPPASHAFRLTVVTKLHEQMARLNTDNIEKMTFLATAGALTEQDLIVMALDEEEKVARESRVVYSNVVKLRIMALKKMTLDGWKRFLSERVSRSLGAGTTLGNTAVQPKAPSRIETGLTAQEELSLLSRFHARLPELSQYGYISTVPSSAEVEDARKGVEAAKGWEVCDRCKARFQVFLGDDKRTGYWHQVVDVPIIGERRTFRRRRLAREGTSRRDMLVVMSPSVRRWGVPRRTAMCLRQGR